MSKKSRLHCPRCVEMSLKPHRVNDTQVVVESCRHCHGVWFDADELNQVAEVAALDLAPPRDAKLTGMTCPRCRIPIEAFYYPQTRVEIDMCGKCHGLWLMPGEFTEIRVIREQLEKKGKLKTHAAVGGVKGTLLGWIDSAITQLSDFD